MNTRKTIHIISQAHLDLAWLWNWRQSIAEALNNLNTITRLMNEYKNMTFSYSNAFLYQWIKKTSPMLFKEIQRLVQEGRWEIVGGWLVESDCNLPSGESLIRQALYGKSFFMDNFNVDVKVGYCPDAFGHCDAIPKILKSTGFDYYVFSKPRLGNDFPHLFKWRSADGSEIITWRIHGGYATGPDTNSAALENEIQYAAANNFTDGCNHTAFFLGLGDHGGGPSEEQIQKIIELSENREGALTKFSTLTELFETLRKEQNSFKNLKVIEGEIHHHNIGCYSAHGGIKKANRKTEFELQTAESISTLSVLLGYSGSQDERLKEMWEDLLFNHFHDIIAGTCIPECYQDADEMLASTRLAAKKITAQSLFSISQNINTSNIKNNAVFAFNPLPWAREEIIAIDMFTAIDGSMGSKIASAIDPETGTKIPIQFANADSPYGPWLKEWKKLLLKTSLPAFGYRVLELSAAFPDSIKQNFDMTYTASDNVLGINELYDSSGNIFTADAIKLIVCKDDSDTFGHGHISFMKEPENVPLAQSYSLENGPLRKRLRLAGTYGNSALNLDIITYSGLDFFDLVIYGNWQENNKVLKLELPFNLKEVEASFQMPFGAVSRKTDGNEVPGHSWCSISGKLKDNSYSVGIINDGIYSFDVIDAIIHVTLRRSVQYTHYGECKQSEESGITYLDQGHFSHKIRILPQQDTEKVSQLDRYALEFNIAPCSFTETRHDGALKLSDSFFRLEANHTHLTTLKLAKNKKDLIIRLVEAAGKGEEILIISDLLNLRHTERMEAYQIKTISFSYKDSEWKSSHVNALEIE
ncbi:MAG: hypothetical protein A2020_11285 [Lentisphaerae bacterium GWF2_45_14]|nr:MAG: hypothetical protein A2020_11285 [Lentisphaerae bacterium GWF2_45_14]